MEPVDPQLIGFVLLIWCVVKLIYKIGIREYVVDKLSRIVVPDIIASELP